MLLRPFCCLLLIGLSAAWGVAHAADAPAASAPSAPSTAQQRARINADRDRIEAQFTAEQAACQQRFVVTACTDDVRLRRRAALAAPRAQASALDDVERYKRAAARREAVAQKQRRAAERPVPAPPVITASVAPMTAPMTAPVTEPVTAPVTEPVTAPVEPASAPKAHAATSSAAAAAAHRAQALKARQTQIQHGQARIEARQAEHARAHKPSTPLPMPPAASMPLR